MKSNNQIAVEEWRRRTRKKLIKGFDGNCCVCGYNKSTRGLCFHHLDPEKKDFSISNGFMNNKSWDKLIKEVEKCVLVCHNCHQEIHDNDCDTIVPEDALRFNLSLIGIKSIYNDCPECGAKKINKNKYCSHACAAVNTGFDWKSVDVVKLYIELGSYNAVAKEIGISDVAVAKRLRKEGILVKMKDIFDEAERIVFMHDEKTPRIVIFMEGDTNQTALHIDGNNCNGLLPANEKNRENYAVIAYPKDTYAQYIYVKIDNLLITNSFKDKADPRDIQTIIDMADKKYFNDIRITHISWLNAG